MLMLDHACCIASSHSTLIHLKSSTYIENNQKKNTYYLFPPPPTTHLAMPDLLMWCPCMCTGTGHTKSGENQRRLSVCPPFSKLTSPPLSRFPVSSPSRVAVLKFAYAIWLDDGTVADEKVEHFSTFWRWRTLQLNGRIHNALRVRPHSKSMDNGQLTVVVGTGRYWL